MRSHKGLIALVVIAVLMIVVADLSRPREIDWSLSFSRHDKTPHGAYLMHHFLPEVFPESQVSVGYNNIVTAILQGPLDSLTHILIDDGLHFDSYATNLMMAGAEAGITFFLSAFDITGELSDTLGFETRAAGFQAPEGDTTAGGAALEDLPPPGSGLIGMSDSLRFATPAAGMPAGYGFDRPVGYLYFSRIDTARTVVLAYDRRDRPVLVRIDHGAGHFFLSLTPLAFTNYHLLEDATAQFTFEALAYLPDQDVHWNEYHKPGYRATRNLMRFVLRTEALRWAYFSGLAFVLLFIVFHARRRQRIVPLLPPKKNVTIEFTQTIGRLYESHRSHRSVAEKRTAYFLNYLRANLHVNTERLDDALARTVADRSGVSHDTVNRLFSKISAVRGAAKISARDLAELNRLLEDFYENAKR